MKIKKGYSVTIIFILLTPTTLCQAVALGDSILRPPSHFSESTEGFIKSKGTVAEQTVLDEHLNRNDTYAAILREIVNVGPQGQPSQASLVRRELLIEAYPEIVRSIIAYFEKTYPDTDFSSLKIIITIGGSASTGVAIDGSDIDLYFIIDDSELPQKIKLKDETRRKVVLIARAVMSKIIDEYGLTGIRQYSPGKIYRQKAWFLSHILKHFRTHRFDRPIANAFLISCGPVESIRRKLLSELNYPGRYKKWQAIQKKWATYVNNKHVNRLGATQQGLHLNLPDLATMLKIYNIAIPDGIPKLSKQAVTGQSL